MTDQPQKIQVRGARVHNLKNIDVDIPLHPQDVETLLTVFRTLIDHGASVIVIEHDLDVIRAADYVIDMGPGGGADGGRIVACGTPDAVRTCAESVTGRFL